MEAFLAAKRGVILADARKAQDAALAAMHAEGTAQDARAKRVAAAQARKASTAFRRANKQAAQTQPYLVLSIFDSYVAAHANEGETGAVDWLENDLGIFLAGYMVRAKADGTLREWQRVDRQLSLTRRVKQAEEPTVARRAQHLWEFMCRRMSHAQVEMFLRMLKVKNSGSRRLQELCMPETGAAARPVWNSRSAVCRGVRPGASTKLVDDLLSVADQQARMLQKRCP